MRENVLKNEYAKHVGYKQFVIFLSTVVIYRSVKTDLATKKRDLSVYNKTLNTHIISPN